MKKLILKLSYLLAISFLLVSCYPGGAEYTSDTDIVLTNYNDAYDFGAQKTYFMSDSIQHLVDDGDKVDTQYDKTILQALESNFEARGYTRVIPDSTNPGPEPDFSVVVTALKTTTTTVYGGYPWYGGWGWGWYWKKKGTQYYGYPGYGWGYPYYPTYVTSYTTGTVVWDMFDPENVDEDNEIVNVDWTGAINGLAGSSASTTKDRIETNINQAFLQSTYIQSK